MLKNNTFKIVERNTKRTWIWKIQRSSSPVIHSLVIEGKEEISYEFSSKTQRISYYCLSLTYN